jgi:hypothetical protein
MRNDPLRRWTLVRCRRTWRGRRFSYVVRMPDELIVDLELHRA